MLNTWIILIVAIAAETFATTMVRASEGFTRLLPSLGVVAGYAVSFYGLSQVVKVMNLGIAYAIWAGLGIFLVSIFSWFLFGQKLDLPAIAGMGLILSGVVVIQLFSSTVTH
ncbi:TPA: multidrug DMT transporter [Klebsiella aerogenes]|jgi:small multidrug resistance pump|uniref:SMR family transporter n=2 Tax=Enterobacteriaceae TaxID=543 RepID=A0AAW9LTP0_KLEAE|nr:SMR family transporter [Klebsiella aerogenes]AKK80795.1 multidrug DMT transporter [Klebsiella aerogenes]AMH11912.1 multidrug DMT transporter [Klebsiella aerogenes]AML35780.1 Multidrug transporter EmrE [Klebsiella aerogenes]AMQ61743.1 multidrug DMT transporter [Klebsiella aerogenes]ATM90999.1 multidrug DMT transporter [Klebsiella aerogenes]